MCSTNIVHQTDRLHHTESPEFCSELPMCPNACGPLSFTGTHGCKSARLHCQGCRWEILLNPQEERDLVEALAGLNPDLHLDLFLVALVQAHVNDLHETWWRADEALNAARDRWRELLDMTLFSWREWQGLDAEADAWAARRDAMEGALAKLRGVSPDVIRAGARSVAA
jgi:hypothetical protein